MINVKNLEQSLNSNEFFEVNKNFEANSVLLKKLSNSWQTSFSLRIKNSILEKDFIGLKNIFEQIKCLNNNLQQSNYILNLSFPFDEEIAVIHFSYDKNEIAKLIDIFSILKEIPKIEFKNLELGNPNQNVVKLYDNIHLSKLVENIKGKPFSKNTIFDWAIESCAVNHLNLLYLKNKEYIENYIIKHKKEVLEKFIQYTFVNKSFDVETNSEQFIGFCLSFKRILNNLQLIDEFTNNHFQSYFGTKKINLKIDQEKKLQLFVEIGLIDLTSQNSESFVNRLLTREKNNEHTEKTNSSISKIILEQKLQGKGKNKTLKV